MTHGNWPFLHRFPILVRGPFRVVCGRFPRFASNAFRGCMSFEKRAVGPKSKVSTSHNGFRATHIFGQHSIRQIVIMFASRRLLQACRITLFSRDNCGLCHQAKGVLSDVWDKRPFVYTEINLAKPESKSWKDLYDFDIPVVWSCSLRQPRNILKRR